MVSVAYIKTVFSLSHEFTSREQEKHGGRVKSQVDAVKDHVETNRTVARAKAGQRLS